jgi:hypothetical protein
MKINLQSSIDENQILVTSPEHCTTFINVGNLKPIGLLGFNANVRLLGKRLKENKIKFSRKGAKFVKENYAAYSAEVARYRNLYFDLRKVAEAIVSEGLESPTVGNERLKEANKIVSEMDKMNWRSTILSRVTEIDFYVKTALKMHLDGYSKVSI